MRRIPEGPDRFRAFAFGVPEGLARPVDQLTSVSAYVKIRGRRPSGLVFGVCLWGTRAAVSPMELLEVEPLHSFRETAVRRKRSRCESGSV
jgi:hypothetical protein